MKYLIILILSFALFKGYSQSIFKRVPKPSKQATSFALSTNTLPITKFVWRLVPIAGYMYPQNQIVAGMGYGIQRIHWVDSTQRYYTNWSISGAAILGGDTKKPVTPNNIMSLGISLGALNQLANFGLYYNLPKRTPMIVTKGSFGFVVHTSIPLN